MSISNKFKTTVIALSFLGFVIMFYGFYPGVMAWDSFRMWNEAVEWNLTGWHHPYLSIIMAIGLPITGDPSALLFLQLALLWSGAAIIALAFYRSIGWWAIVAVLICYSPPIVALQADFHKTPLISSCFIFCFSICYYYYTRKTALPILASVLLFLIYIFSMPIRDYSYVLAFPLVLFFFHCALLDKIFSKKLLLILFLTTSTCVGSFILNQYIVYDVLNIKNQYKMQVPLRTDLAGIYIESKKIYADEMLVDLYRDYNRAKYDYLGNDGDWHVYQFYKGAETEGDFKRYISEWLRAVWEQPGAYVRHRIRNITKAFSIDGTVFNLPPLFKSKNYLNHKKNKYGVEKLDSNIFQALRIYLIETRFVDYIRLIYWVLINVLTLAISCFLVFKKPFNKDTYPFIALLLSGLLFFIINLFIGNSVRARFTYWSILSTSFGAFGIVTYSVLYIRSLIGKRSGAYLKPMLKSAEQ